MKKRVLSVLLVVVMLVGLLPTSVLATGLTAYELYIGGVQVTELNKDDLVKAINDAANATVATGTATYIPATADVPATLVLNNFSYEGNGYKYDEWYDLFYYAAIFTEEALNIVLQGENAIACMGTDDINCIAIYCDAALTISGNTTGSLTLSDAVDGVYAYYGTIEGATVEIHDVYCGIYGESLTINDSTININSDSEGVSIWEDVVIKNSIVDIFAEYSAMNGVPILEGEHKVYSGYTVAGLYEYPESERDDWTYEARHVQIIKEDVEYYLVWIDEKQFTQYNLTFTDANGGTATYTPATSTAPATLTLNNFNHTSEGELMNVLERWKTYSVITSTDETLNIVLQGENSIICTGVGDEHCDFFGISGWNLTITGDGGNDSLTVSGGSLGIDGLSVNIENCTLEAVGGLCAIANIWEGPLVPTLNSPYNVYAGTVEDHPAADAAAAETYNSQYIKFVPTYTVTYKVDEDVVYTEVVEHGKDATAPAIPVKEGYDETAPKWDHDGKNITSNMTITAVYTKNEPGEYADVTPESNVGGGKLTEKIEDLKEKVPFTQEEAKQIEYGADVKIWLEIKDISATVSEADKAEVEKNLGDGKVAMHLNVAMLKQVGENEISRLTQLNGKVQIAFKLADSYINANKNVTRTYSIIHVHNGKAEIITPVFDAATKTLTFATDRFSSYAVVYTDVTTAPPAEIPATGDNFQLVFWVSCMSLSFLATAALLVVSKRKYVR